MAFPEQTIHEVAYLMWRTVQLSRKQLLQWLLDDKLISQSIISNAVENEIFEFAAFLRSIETHVETLSETDHHDHILSNAVVQVEARMNFLNKQYKKIKARKNRRWQRSLSKITDENLRNWMKQRGYATAEKDRAHE